MVVFMSKLTNDDKYTIIYFLEETGDLSQWEGLKGKQDLIQTELPLLTQALADFRLAEHRLKMEVEQLKASIDE